MKTLCCLSMYHLHLPLHGDDCNAIKTVFEFHSQLLSCSRVSVFKPPFQWFCITRENVQNAVVGLLQFVFRICVAFKGDLHEVCKAESTLKSVTCASQVSRSTPPLSAVNLKEYSPLLSFFHSM